MLFVDVAMGYFVANFSKALDGSLDHVDPEVVMSGQVVMFVGT